MAVKKEVKQLNDMLVKARSIATQLTTRDIILLQESFGLISVKSITDTKAIVVSNEVVCTVSYGGSSGLTVKESSELDVLTGNLEMAATKIKQYCDDNDVSFNTELFGEEVEYSPNNGWDDSWASSNC